MFSGRDSIALSPGCLSSLCHFAGDAANEFFGEDDFTANANLISEVNFSKTQCGILLNENSAQRYQTLST